MPIPSGYFNGFQVARYDVDGVRIVLPGETLDVALVGGGSLGTVTVDDFGNVDGALIFGALNGDVIEFSLSGYPDKLRRTVAISTDAAADLAANSEPAYVVENLWSTATDAVTAEIWMRDTDNPDKADVYVGNGIVGVDNTFEFDKVVGGNKRFYAQPLSADGRQAFNRYTDANYADFLAESSIPAADGSGDVYSYLASDSVYHKVDVFADSPLEVTVVDNGIYHISVTIFATSDTQALQVCFGGTATINHLIGQWIARINDTPDAGSDTFARQTVTAAGTDKHSDGDLDGLRCTFTFEGTVEINDPGTFNIQASQNVEADDDTTMLRGSDLQLIKLN